MQAALLPLIRQRARVLKASRPPVRPMPAQSQPDTLRADYWRTLNGYVREAEALVLERLAPVLAELPQDDARADALVRLDAATPDQARRAMAAAAKELVGGTTNARLSGWARAIGSKVSDFQRQQLQRQFTASLGIDILGADVMRTEPYLRTEISRFTDENVDLIRSLSTRYFGQVESLVVDAIRGGTRAPALAAAIRAKTGAAEKQAALIARDQVGKFFGHLNQVRQTKLGVERFRWMTVRDNRVRLEHVDRHGDFFPWSSPPEDGIPGHPINCRCWADPDVAALLASL